MVQYQPINIQEEDSVNDLILQIDTIVQYDEFKMPKESMLPREDFDDENDDEGGQMGFE